MPDRAHPLLAVMGRLDALCEGGGSEGGGAQADAACAEAEAFLNEAGDGRGRGVGAEDRRRLKAALTKLWAALSKLPYEHPAFTMARKARAREACTKMLVYVVYGQGGGKMESELARAWLKTGKEYLAARRPPDAVRCVDAAAAHAGNTPDGSKRAALLSECYLVGIEARAAAGSHADAVAFARSLGGDLWAKEDDVPRLLEVFYDIADAAHNQKNHAGCAEVIGFAVGAPGPLPAPLHARLLMLQSHAFLMLQSNAQALEAAQRANRLHETVLGSYLQCKCHVLDGDIAAARALLPTLCASEDFTAKMAMSVAHALAACGQVPDAVRVLREVKERTADGELRLMALLCRTGDDDAAFDAFDRIARAHIRGDAELPAAQLAAVYSTAYGRAQRLEGAAAERWLVRVAEVIPPSQASDKAKACCALAHHYIEQENFADALCHIREAASLEPSAYTTALMIMTYLNLDAVAEAEGDLKALAAMDDPLVARLAAWIARAAYEKGNVLLAGMLVVPAPASDHLQRAAFALQSHPAAPPEQRYSGRGLYVGLD